MFCYNFGSAMPSPFKVTTENYSHTIKTSRSKVAALRSYVANDLNFQGWSWSHKLESLCC